MNTGDFHYIGMYRVQSRKKGQHSEIIGSWRNEHDGLSSEKLNEFIARHPWWKGRSTVQMRSADVCFRSGMFASDPDILVKKQFFSPEEGTPPMEFDFVDVNKSYQFWHERKPYLQSLFGEQSNELFALIPSLKFTIVNEYYCHEAGHCLGYDVRSKYEEGYFRLKGKSLWPLIFVEEYRADLHSFTIAAQTLPAAAAAAIFIYNLLLRWGVEAQSLSTSQSAYGSVPYLLFCFLYHEGFIEVTEHGLRLAATDQQAIISMMHKAGEHAFEQLTSFEMEGDKTQGAIMAANYFRQRVTNQQLLHIYEDAFMRTTSVA
jgi:hypothetical protein